MKKTAKYLFYLVIAGFLAACIGIYSLYIYVKDDLPSVEVLKDVEFQTPMKVYSADGKLISQFGEKRRIPLSYEEIPQDLINALLATEDSRFYQHNGVDFIGILRAAFTVLTTGQKKQGASTLTMQVARGFFLTRDKTYIRKIKEVFIALHIERELTKNEILTLYINKMELGNRAFGFGAAAKVYYGKSIEELDITQIAMLTGLLKAPTAYNPLRNKERAMFRRNTVLWRLKETNYITEEIYQTAIQQPLTAKFHGAQIELDAPYIAEMVRQEMIDLYGDKAYTQGLQVYTSITADNQNAAIKAVRKNLHNYDERHGLRENTNFLWQEEEEVPTQQALIEKLQSYKDFGLLENVVVTQIDEENKHFIFLRKSGDLGIVKWENMEWAKPFIDDDKTGPAPTTVSEVVNLGQVVSIRATDSGWRLAQFPAASAAFIAINPTTGEIQALVGGYDFRQSEFNRVTQAVRQVGSNIKPFLYSAALEHGFTLASIINDAPINQWDRSQGTAWRPKNSPAIYDGPIRMKVALAKSKNVVSVRLLRAIGVNNVIDHLSQFGFERDQLKPNESLALGSASFTPLQLASAFTAFANKGITTQPYLISKILDSDDHILFETAPTLTCEPDCELANSQVDEDNRAVSEQNAFLIADAMKSTIWGGGSWANNTGWNGTGWRAQSLKRRDLGGKTGTTNEAKDTWFTGYGPNVVATSWVGFDDNNRSLGKESGATAALPAWITYMQTALANSPNNYTPIPENIITARIDQETGKLTHKTNYTADFEYFIKGTEPTQYVESAPKVDILTAEHAGEVVEVEQEEIF